MENDEPRELELGEFLLSTDNARLDVDVVHRYLAFRSYWAKGIQRATVDRAVQHSLCAGVYLGDVQIGFGRVVTDRATYAYFCDIFLIEEYQRKGLGTELLKFLHESPALRGVRRWHLETEHEHSFYEKHGWVRTDGGGRWMEIVRPHASDRC
jgi:GNAT superfamily N-acetyltransferase